MAMILPKSAENKAHTLDNLLHAYVEAQHRDVTLSPELLDEIVSRLQEYGRDEYQSHIRHAQSSARLGRLGGVAVVILSSLTAVLILQQQMSDGVTLEWEILASSLQSA